METPRAMAWAAPVAFVALAATLVAVGAIAIVDGAVAAVAVLFAYLPSGWVAPGGWPRRAAEAALLPCGYALAMLGDATMLRMALPPLLVLAGLAAATAAVPRSEETRHPLLVGALALAVRAACGLGLVGVAPWAAAAALVTPLVLAWGATRWGGAALGTVVALVAGAAPLQQRPWLALGLIAAGVALARAPRFAWTERLGRGWLAGAVTAGLALSTVAAWAGLPLARVLPAAAWPAVAAAVAALALTPLLPRGAAAAAWLGVTLLAGPLQPAPPDIAGFTLAPGASVELPAATGGPYVVELALANAASVPHETVVAVAQVGDTEIGLRAGLDAAEWAHERPDVRATVAHTLPVRPVWRPLGFGSAAPWTVAGKTVATLPTGLRPAIERAPGLAERVGVSVLSAGPSRATPPRTWTLGSWLLAAAAVVALLQLLAGTWRSAAAWLPWALLAAASLAARFPVEPQRLLLERYAVDVALAALLAAWVPAAVWWIARRRVFLAAAALLLPLAAATPHLMPSGGDEPYHLILLRSLAEDGDLALDNNYDLDRFPGNRIYITPKLMHSPVLAALLLPGYAAAGRTGGLLLLALGGAGVVALVVRRAQGLGVPRARIAIFAVLLCTTYPLATFSTEIWTEVPGALAAALCLVAVASLRNGPLVAASLGVVAAAIKTRLALVTFPIALAGLLRQRSDRRRLGLGLLVFIASAAAGLAAGYVIYGHPLGPFRRFVHLVPGSFELAVTVVGGLLFDPAAGVLFAAPLALVAATAMPRMWREGGVGERGLLLGLAATVAALLGSIEWYGGGSPPLRYLIPALPVVAVAGALLLKGASRVRRFVPLLVPFAFFVWWVVVARPQLGFNPGDGGWWLSAALARRFAAAALHLFPSYLVRRSANVIWPLAILGLAALAWQVAQRWPSVVQKVARLTAAAWLLLGAVTVIAVTQRLDTVVEVEEPQVVRRGGAPVPPTGTYSRFRYANGWRLDDGAEVTVPLHLAAGVVVGLTGWVDNPDGSPAFLKVGWDEAEPEGFPLSADLAGSLPLPPPPGGGRHRLHIGLTAEGTATVVLDRVEVLP